MTRTLNASLKTELTSSKFYPIVFYEGAFASSNYLRLWSGYGTIIWNSLTWTGAGNLMSITPIQEATDIQATGFAVVISGMPSANIAIALASCQQGLSGKVWLGAMDSAGAVVGGASGPSLVRQGRMDVPTIEESGETCTVTLQYEDRLVDLERPRERRYTNADQQIEYPNDLGFDQVPALQDAQDIWGS
jgi:hypothetical protein